MKKHTPKLKIQARYILLISSYEQSHQEKMLRWEKKNCNRKNTLFSWILWFKKINILIFSEVRKVVCIFLSFRPLDPVNATPRNVHFWGTEAKSVVSAKHKLVCQIQLRNWLFVWEHISIQELLPDIFLLPRRPKHQAIQKSLPVNRRWSMFRKHN